MSNAFAHIYMGSTHDKNKKVYFHRPYHSLVSLFRWRAFSSYGLPSAIIIDPENKDGYRALFDDMIWAMKSRKAWEDFTDRGFGSDPITAQNIMYNCGLEVLNN